MLYTKDEKYCVANVVYGHSVRRCRSRVKEADSLCWKHRAMKSEKDEELADVLAVLERILTKHTFGAVRAILLEKEHRAARQVRTGSGGSPTGVPSVGD